MNIECRPARWLALIVILAMAPVAAVLAAEPIVPDAQSALIVDDPQNCFVAGDALAVKDGDAVVERVDFHRFAGM